MPAEESRVAINSDQDIVLARQKGRALAADSGFSAVDATLIATAISELARNIVTYAKHGEITLSALTESGRRGIGIVASDQGPGIADIRRSAMDFRPPAVLALDFRGFVV